MKRLLAGFLLLALSLPAQAADFLPVTITTKAGPVELQVEVAVTQQEHEKGLMLRKHIPDRQGMLFAFNQPQKVTMWMKNTLVPLDMIFIDADNTISNLAENTTPNSLDLIRSGGPVKAVIEVAGGTAHRYHIATGDKALYSLRP